MKRRFLYLATIYFGLLLVFVLQKPLFMFFQSSEMLTGVAFGDWFRVMRHGVKLDINIAGYVMLIPWIIIFISAWVTGGKWAGVANRIYFIFTSMLLATLFVGNMLLYPFWGFPLDVTPLFYIKTPVEAVAGVSGGVVIMGFSLAIIIWLIMNRGFRFATKLIDGVEPVTNKWWWSSLMVVIGGVLVFGIRGGVEQSTANVGRVYFSDNMFLNHAAVNPAFSLMTSMSRERNLSEGYEFFEQQQRAVIFDTSKAAEADTILRVLKTDRPDVLMVILESFTMNILAESVDGESVTPKINQLIEEGVWFPEFYANSFRTDRGLVSILNGYPAQPTTSIMKYPIKSQTLPSIASKLKKEGYLTEMLYGGDIDFTNMRSYFYASGYRTVTGNDGLELDVKKSDWGYHDDIMFEELLRRMKAKQPGEKSFTTLLSLSSHEPFRVPFERFANPVLNSMAFTDDCLGRFIDRLKITTLWDNLLVIFVADHALNYPSSLNHYDISRYHIPMLWIGGAIAEPMRVEGVWSQSDIAATLMRQLGLDESEFTFSRNIFNPLQSPSAFYTFNNGFGFLDDSGATVWDCDSKKALLLQGEQGASQREKFGKAILQTLMEDMERR